MNASDYLKGHKASGFKVGDRVRVTRIAKDYEWGWPLVWINRMDSYVNEEGIIREDIDSGFDIDFGDGEEYYYFPYFVLECMGKTERTLAELVEIIKEKPCTQAMPWVIEAIELIAQELEQLRKQVDHE